jgi:transposase
MVWTKQNRGRYDRRGQRYPSDLTNEEWAILEPLLPVRKGSGGQRMYSLREIMNGIGYVLRYGIPWDAMLTIHQFLQTDQRLGRPQRFCRQVWMRRRPRLKNEVRLRATFFGAEPGVFFRREVLRFRRPTCRSRRPNRARVS